MEIRFENNYERTPAVMKEIYRFLFFKRPVNIVLYILLGGIVAWNVVSTLLSGDYRFTACVYVLIFLVMQFVMYRNAVRNAISRDKAQFGVEGLSVHTQVSEEGIRCTYGERVAKPIELCNIKKVIKTKNLILLHTNTRLLLIFRKDNFTVGTQEEFLEYLRSNGLKA